MKNDNIIDYFREAQLPEKFYESCITCNIIDFFKEERAERIFPFSISPVREKQEGYDFGYEVSDNIFLLQYKRPYKNGNSYRWDIDTNQLRVILNNAYASVVYYALPMFDNYKMWYQVLSNNHVKFIDATSLQKYLVKTRKKSVNSTYEGLKNWEEVVFELFGNNCYDSALEDIGRDYQKELIALLKNEGMVGYEIKKG